MNLETSQIREKVLWAVEEYNKMIVTKTNITNEEAPHYEYGYGKRKYARTLRDPTLLYKNDLVGMFYNFLRKNIFSGKNNIYIGKLICEFRKDGTIYSFKIRNNTNYNFTETNLVEDTINTLFSEIPQLRENKIENEILLIVNSIKVK